jgi:hypothetical protein
VHAESPDWVKPKTIVRNHIIGVIISMHAESPDWVKPKTIILVWKLYSKVHKR